MQCSFESQNVGRHRCIYQSLLTLSMLTLYNHQKIPGVLICIIEVMYYGHLAMCHQISFLLLMWNIVGALIGRFHHRGLHTPIDTTLCRTQRERTSITIMRDSYYLHMITKRDGIFVHPILMFRRPLMVVIQVNQLDHQVMAGDCLPHQSITGTVCLLDCPLKMQFQ